MRTFIKILLVAVLTATTVSCVTRKEQAVYSSDSNAIRVNVRIKQVFTKSNPPSDADAEALAFNQGDRVTVTSEDGTVEYEYGKNGWAPTDNYYFRWGSEGVAFNASYPAVKGSDHLNFTAPTNQSTPEKMSAADYMTCSIPAIHNDGSGVLTFEMERKMSKVVYTLKNIEAGNPVKGFKIGSYESYANGNHSASTTMLTPYITIPDGGERGGSGTKYIALAVPGEKSETSSQISLTYKNQLISFSGIPAREAGKMYEYEVVVEGPEIVISEPTVTDWNGEILPGGDATPTKRFHYFIKENGNGSGDSWDDAMGVGQFRSMLCISGSDTEALKAIDKAKFHFAAGTYVLAPEAGDAFRMNYNGSSTTVRLSMDGGYDAASTGTDLTGRDITANKTILSGNDDRRIFIIGSQITLSMDGLEISGAQSDTVGCAVLVNGKSTLNCKDITFSGNNTNDNGAAVSLVGVGCSFSAEDCTFSENTAGKNGGAVYMSNNSESRLVNCRAYANSAVSGGFCQIYKGIMSIDGASSVFSGNTASKSGGCLYLNSEYAHVQLGQGTTSGSIIIAGNSAAIGGALLLETGNGTVDAVNTEFSDNKASSYAGGLAILKGTAILADCTISGNKTNESGGISASDSDITKATGGGLCASGSETVLNLTDCLIAGNMAGKSNGSDSDAYGGAISIAGATVNCVGCEFKGNIANRAGAILMVKGKGGRLTADNCTFHGQKLYSRGVILASEKNMAFFNGCSFYDNVLRGKSSAWGVICQTSANAAICFNNCSMNCPGNGYTSNVQIINADAHTLLTNCTLIGEVVNGAIRSASTGRLVAVNNVIINTKSGQNSIVAASSNEGFHVEYNVLGPCDVSPHEISATNLQMSSASAFSWSDDCYLWAGPGSIGFTGCKLSDVKAACGNFNVNATSWGGSLSSVTSVGEEFCSWLESMTPSAITVDQHGTARSETYWPGSYQE